VRASIIAVKEFGLNSKLTGRITIATSKYQKCSCARGAEVMGLVYGLQMIIGSSQDRLEKMKIFLKSIKYSIVMANFMLSEVQSGSMASLVNVLFAWPSLH
jgi:hypothetical protein